MVSILKTTRLQSTAISVAGRPSIAIRPPWVMFAIISRSAAGWPDISMPTSKPSDMSSSGYTSPIECLLTSSARSTPILRARSSRASLTSVITTCRAPACFATAAAISPIGPAPVISTSSPSTGKDSAVWTALPNGSKIAATSRSTSWVCTHAFCSGSTAYSANAPAVCTPRPIVLAHRCRRPALQLRQVPQTRCPSPLTRSPTFTLVTPAPISTTSPTNSWPTTSGGVIVAAAQSSHDSMCRSVPQIPVRSTRSLTSAGPGCGSGTSVSRNPGPWASLTRAFTHSSARRWMFSVRGPADLPRRPEQ